MKNLHVLAAGFLTTAILVAPQSLATDRYVATSGSNSWPGTVSQPYRTIKYAISQAVSGDVIRVRAGTYDESYITVKSGITILSQDGPRAAKVACANSISFIVTSGYSNVEIDGFEVYANYIGGSATDGLLRAYNCSNVRFRNMLIHDAPNDADCVKIGGAGTSTTNILLENCEVYNPAKRTSGYQECVDIYPATYVTVRGCWIYHTPDKMGDTLIYAKGNSSNILWENNVFGPRYGDAYGNASTSAGGPSPSTFPSCSNFVARNNLFLSCSGDAAFALLSTNGVEFYNNVIWNYCGTRAPIEFWSVGSGGNTSLKFYNNIIYNSNGMGVFQDRGSYTPTTFLRDNNIYYQVPGGGSVNLATETHSLFVNPLLVSPATPTPVTDSWAAIVARFNLQAGSPAINAGYDLTSLVTTDILGVARPQAAAFDIGAYEYVAPNQAPTVNAGSDQVVYEGNLVSLHAVANDADGDALTCAWTRTAGPAVSLIGADTADASFVAPTRSSPSDGTVTLLINVTDTHAASASDSVAVTVFMAGDATHDNFVNVGDLQVLVANWGGGNGGPADFNADNFVNVGDLQTLVANWGRSL